MATPSELFDDLAQMLHGYCDAPEVVIRVEMDFREQPIVIDVVRHIYDPDNIFDKSNDTNLALEASQLALVRSKVEAYFELSRQWQGQLLTTSLSIYQDGLWSVGSTTKDE